MRTTLLTKIECLLVMLSAITVFVSCSNGYSFEEEQSEALINELSEKSAMSRFAEILSKATYKRQDVRDFLKKEAIKQFDKNYDILYVNVKDSYVGDETFCEILNHYAVPGELESIERSVPTINIYIPKISMCGVTPENMDCEDNETPVVLPEDANNKLYLNGIIVDSLARGDVPGFHVFVVNKNSRVIVDDYTRLANKRFNFIAPEYDNSISEPSTRGTLVDGHIVGAKAIAAYSFFNKDDGSNQSTALQRDYIYYGMTPSSTIGKLNQNVTEYISYIEIDPQAYFMMIDKTSDDKIQTSDPYIKKNTISRKKRDFTTQELINELWTQGCYNLRIEIATSVSNQPFVKRLPLLPDDIWNFNMDKTYRHSTAFRHSKYTYTIDPSKFTSKKYYLASKYISFGKWDLANESLCREVTFEEEDPGETLTFKHTIETIKVNSTKVNGDVKFGLGLGTKDSSTISVNIGAEYNHSTTIKDTNEFIITRTNKDDNLGMDKVYFYDPIIERQSGSQYLIKEYNTGIVSFGITAI